MSRPHLKEENTRKISKLPKSPSSKHFSLQFYTMQFLSQNPSQSLKKYKKNIGRYTFERLGECRCFQIQNQKK